MKRMMCVLLALALCLTLCGCGRRKAAPADPGPTVQENTELSAPEPTLPPFTTTTQVEITLDNWASYFEICEIPLYMLNPNGGVLEVEQNYCVCLRDEFAHRLQPLGASRVDFEIGFDVYVNTLDYDAENNLFLHTNDLLYAVWADHSCVFTSSALPKTAYGSNYGAFLKNYAPSYQNAFFTGSAHYTDGVWAGFYVDLNTIQVLSASGTLELGY